MCDEYKLGVLHHPAPHIELYSEPHRSASAICGAMVYGCAIDFLFIDNGNTQTVIIYRNITENSQSTSTPGFRLFLYVLKHSVLKTGDQ